MTQNEAAAVAQDDIDNAAAAADQDNPFKVAGDNVPLPEDTNVIEIDSRRGIPADRLPTEGVFKLPSRKSLYHTERAEAARDRAAQEMLDLNQTVQLLIKAGLKRNNVKYPDVADHNAATLAYALEYAANGLHVIDSHAIDPKTGVGTGPHGSAKLPRGSKWQERASNDPQTIKTFWTGDGNYPENKDGETYRYARVSAPRNVSIAFPEACEMFVLDIDGDDGKRALAALEAEHGSLPVTAKSITGSGGWHFIFRTGRPIRNTASQIASGVDIRGEGGQIIAPPSIHKTGNFYQWEVAPGDVIADAPEWLVDLAFSATKANAVKDSKGRAHKATGTVNPRTGQSYDSHGFEAILDTIGDHADGGGFDTPIYRAACSWFSANGADIDVTELQEVLREVILAAECDDDRAETRYGTDDYLSNRIEQARAFILSARSEDSTAEEDVTPDALAGDLGDASKSPEECAEALTTQHSEATIYKFIKGLHDEGVDKVVQGNVTAIIAKQTSLTKPDVKKFWRELDAAEKRRVREEDKAKGGDAGNYILTTDPAPEQTQYAINAIKSGNDRDPFLFEYMDEAAIVRKGRIKVLDRDGRTHQLGKVTAFHRPKGDGETQHIFPPFDVVNDVFSADLSDFLLPLRGSVDTPFFAADGTLVTQNGYHGGSQIVMQSDLVIDRVSDHPTQEEARDAARYIVEEVLADFPLGGLSREEIMGKFQTPDGVPAIANAMALILLPFARAMISGPTPGHIVNKPAPGTGAGFLVDVCTTIGSGQPAPALPMPTNKEELGKTLGAVLRDGERAIFFDNINHSVDSPELAAAMTAPATGYKMRILGTTETAIVQIMAAWVFAANTLTMSGELLRRCILIDLDRRHPTPGAWTPNGGWRHKDVREWTRGNRARLVHACLTIIQRWVAEGMKKSDHNLGSFENWAGVMGGVLSEAGIGGFMGNQSDLTGLSNGCDDELTDVAQAIADTMHGVEGSKLFVRSMTDADNGNGKFGLFDILHAMDPVPRLADWGYKEVFDGTDIDVVYSNTRSAGLRFKAAAKRTYSVMLDGKVRSVRFEIQHDTTTNSNCYTMEMS